MIETAGRSCWRELHASLPHEAHFDMGLRRSADGGNGFLTRAFEGCTRACSLLVAASLLGGCHVQRMWFQDSGARPIRVSDVQEPATRVALVRGAGYELAPARKAPETTQFGEARNYLLVDVGYINPIVAFSNRTWGAFNSPDQPFAPRARSDSTAPPPPGRTDGRWAVQVSLPIAFHLFWDPFTENSPILDTDYTFGADVAFRIALADGVESRIGVSKSHISTHLGDEYVISSASSERGPFPFDRVNVSYWPVRAWTSLRVYRIPNWMAELTAEAERIGNGGHYVLFPGEADPGRVPLSRATTEAAVTLDVRQAKGVQLSPSAQSAEGYFRGALTVANRSVFPYHNGLSNAEKRLQANAVVGYVLPQRLRLGSRQVMVYGRLLSGPNPYGQFRNQASTWFAGLGVMVLP